MQRRSPPLQLTTEATPDTKCGANKAVAPDAASFEKPTTSPKAQSHALPDPSSYGTPRMTGVGDVAKFILLAKGIVDVAIRNIPQAALPWAGVCVRLQILLNPATASSANLAGIAHGLGLIFPQGLANWDDWDAYLKTVIDAEGAVLKDWAQYDQCHAHDSREKLVKCAEGMESVLQAIRHDIRDFIALQKGMRRDTEDEECLRDLFVVDPQDDMKKIEKKKDKLLNEAYKWVLDTKEYAALTDWNHDAPGQPSRRLMWIKGPAGTGKTMLLIGIIRELSSHRAKLAPDLSHFFCQGTDAALNSATATLRSLVWLLLVQQPHLISHLRSKHKHAGSSLFKGDTAFIALSDAFKNMLKDPDLFPVYFVVDALDESLVFKELDAVDGNQSPLHGSYALHRFRTIPSGLLELYKHIMNRIEEGFDNDPQYCKNVLVVATLAFRPSTLSELAVLAELPDDMEPRTISVKDYLHKNYESRLYPAGMAQGHADTSRRSFAGSTAEWAGSSLPIG
ncbi:hypothetical protein MY5147_006525 [Beauveria neobassiana]